MAAVRPSQHIGGATSAADRYRLEVAEYLCEFVAGPFSETRQGRLSVKAFQARLAEVGVHVSRQAVYQWVSGAALPSPRHQTAIAKALGQQPHRLFPPYPLDAER